MMSRFSPPYIGAAYYPEAWPPDLVDDDIRLMLDAGMNAMRVAEFAWSSIEPVEGQYDLGWLERVVAKLGDAGIATVMCTPSCTPPAWLTERYPEVLVVDRRGVQAQHGSRRHVCPNNPVYREHVARANRKLAELFGRDENVIGWQVDNEVYIWADWGCYCPLCVKLFRRHLEKRFGTIAALNDAWGTNVWSQTYQSFDQIPAPRPEYSHHPSLLSAWIRFQSDSIVDFVNEQVDLLHDHVTQPVSTDVMPLMGVDYHDLHRKADLVQYNHYDLMDTLWRQVFWMDHARPYKAVPFWNTETQTCWNGGTTSNGFKDPGFCRANSWLPIALGGEMNLYWLWRSHWSGQELMHGAVVDSCGRPLYMIDEVRETARGFRQAADFLNNTRVTPPGLAVHFSSLAWTQLRFQPMVQGFDYVESMLNRVYRPLMNAHLRADVISPAAALDGYQIVFSPFLAALDESGLRERLFAWIQNGGTWVTCPFTDTRTVHGAKPKHAPYVSLEEWTGLRSVYEVPGEPRDPGIQWYDGRASHGTLWNAGFEPNGAAVLATYTDGPVAGLAAAAEARVGRGRIVVLGTLPSRGDLQKLMVHLAGQCEIYPAADASSNVLVAPREGEAGRGAVIIELENQPGRVALDMPAQDVLTGAVLDGEIDIAPYQVLVLRQTAVPSSAAAPAGDGSEATSA